MFNSKLLSTADKEIIQSKICIIDILVEGLYVEWKPDVSLLLSFFLRKGFRIHSVLLKPRRPPFSSISLSYRLTFFLPEVLPIIYKNGTTWKPIFRTSGSDFETIANEQTILGSAHSKAPSNNKPSDVHNHQ